MTKENIKDRRLAPRRDVPIQAVVVGDRMRRILITRDIGPYGAFFVGDYSVKKTTRLHIRLDIAVEENSVPSIISLDAYVSVVRVETTDAGDVNGFATQWIRASSVGDVLPLKVFLKTYLHVAGGFVHVLKPESEGEVPIYSFSFPKPSQAHAAPTEETRYEPVSRTVQESPATIAPEEPATVKEPEKEKTAEESPQKSAQPDIPTRVYATLPIHYIYSGRPFEGTAVKLRKDGIRIDTNETMPDVYSPIEIEISVYTPGKEGTLRLNGTVSLVKKTKHGKGGQFEIKFSLKNPPIILDGYRGMLKMLQESIRQA